MEKNNRNQNDQQNITPPKSIGVDPTIILSLLIKNWYWFIMSAAIALGVAHLYMGHTLPVYETSTTVLVNDNEDQPLVDNAALLQGLGLPGGMKNLQNQMQILASRDLTEKTLKNLPFEIDFYYKTARNDMPIYPEIPISILPGNMLPLPKDTEFKITYLGNSRFSLESQSEYYPFNKTASFGDSIVCSGGTFFIDCWDEGVFNKDKNKQIFFSIHNINSLVNYYSNRLNVELTSREGSILKISLTGTNRYKDADFLNQHIEGFMAISLDRKNTEASRRIQFIEDQLIGISDSLSTTENRLQQFRSSHRVMDLSAQGQSIIGQVALLENERARLSLEANYYDYLADYLSKDILEGIPIVPITMGINDPGLTRLVEDLADLQGQLSSRGAGELNPLQRNLEQKMRVARSALRETLNGLRRANSLARSENQQQIDRANAQATALPVTERQLLGIERKFKLNDELYTFLLEARAEQNMQKASNRSDSEIVDPADPRFSVVVAPNPAMIYLLGMLAGFGLPGLIIFTLFFLNKKLKEEDINNLTNMPIVGHIPQNSGKVNTVVFESPNSVISESYRLLRSRMQFMTKEAASPVILITSSMPGEGKTFTAINLASVYSLLGKKTILIGFDLRKPKIYKDFGLDNKKGITTWLIGQDKLEEIIQETTFENLSIIPSGPIPPNPSELIALEKTGELIKTLKEKYDFIIIDTSPIGIVSDTFHLASMADAFLLVVRPGYTLKGMLDRTLNEITANRTKGVSLVINGFKAGNRYYNYGEKYGYTSEETAKGRLFKRRRAAKG